MRLIIGVLVFLAGAMALWWFWLIHYLMAALIFPAAQVLQWLMPNEVLGLGYRQGVGVVIMTTLAPLSSPFALVEIPLPLTRFTVVFPLFWGLILATPVALGKRLYQLAIGTVLILWPCAVLMVAMYAAFKLGLTINHQPTLSETPPADYVMHLPFPTWAYYLLGVGRQLSVLVLPTLVPLLAWGSFNHTLLRSASIEKILGEKREVIADGEPRVEES